MNWILCDDALPDKDGVYIICGYVTLEQNGKPIPFSDAAEFLSWRSVPWLPVSDMDNVYSYDVLAWMPIPDPL